MKHFIPAIRALVCATACVGLLPAATPATQAREVAGWQAHAPYSQQELDRLLAPIALYPDALLAQVLMAATYPLEVVQAARFVQRNPGLSGEALSRAIEPMGWDPSVAALTQFPSVLAMMNEELEWTERLGDAFLAQREQVMDTVQMLRDRAWTAGTLRPNEHQNVVVRDRVYLIESWRPGYYWVPYYNPLIVYGSWWWPGHPPFLWVPPVVYRPPYFAQVYSVGIVWGPAVLVIGSLWSDPRPVWRGQTVTIGAQPLSSVIVTGARTPRPVLWQHDPQHRRSVEYRTPSIRDRHPPLFPEKPSRVSPSLQPSRDPYLHPAPHAPSVPAPSQIRRMPDSRPSSEPGTHPRQQTPVKPRPGLSEHPIPRQSQPAVSPPAVPQPMTRPQSRQAIPRESGQPQSRQHSPQPQRQIHRGEHPGRALRQERP